MSDDEDDYTKTKHSLTTIEKIVIKEIKMHKVKTRRSFFRYMTALGLVGFYSSPLLAKTAKEIVKYQESPKDGKVCRDCLHFIAETNKCKTVAGPINPEGWCSIYFKNPMLKKDTNESNMTDKTV